MESRGSSTGGVVLGLVLLAAGVAVFGVRLLHEGPYAVPRGGNLLGGVGALALGALFLAPGVPRLLRRATAIVSPVILFFALYAIGAELEETISLYATDSAGRPAELRLWIVDREDGEWAGMPRTKAVEHALDGARLDLLRAGETRCVVPVVSEDRATTREIHAMKVDKYAVARASAVIGLYPREARDGMVAVRFDPCPAG